MATHVSPVLVLGAGGAGVIAAWKAAMCGAPVVVLERNRKAGVKLLISGGGKCNVTHAGPMEEVRTAFTTRESRFLKPAFYRFTNTDLLRLLEDHGVDVYARDNGRVFPKSGRAGDIVGLLVDLMVNAGAELRLDTRVSELLHDDKGIVGVKAGDAVIHSSHVILATGGVSYRRTGTTGDGYAWAKTTGHAIVPLRPALAPIGVIPALPASWRGIAVRSGRLSLYASGRKVSHADGDILFTHEGLSGPAALELSRVAAEAAENKEVDLVLDFFPQRDLSDLDHDLQQRLTGQRGKMIETHLYEWLPNRIVGDLLRRIDVNPETRGYTLTSAQRRSVVLLLKGWKVGRVGTIDIDRGEVTAGGISLDEVDPQTMRSRKIGGLYLAGEVLDIAGPVGGYNLQAAFSTGAVAGESAASDWKVLHN
jgi:predicted Rossmann fold flavoprotein